MTEIIIYLCIGLFSGFMSGMFGIGGGSVRIPLINLAGLPLLSAFPFVPIENWLEVPIPAGEKGYPLAKEH